MIYKKVAKPLLFNMNPELAHHMTIDGLHMACNIPGGSSVIHLLCRSKERTELSSNLWGIRFSNPIGLAAGLDKNAKAVPGFSAMGFGFIEVGTVTPLSQPGNESPRLFRLPEDSALINRMGFNNEGAERMVKRLEKLKHRSIPIAVNIGKNKVTPNDQAEEDYRKCIRLLYSHADFFVVNISSPNTPDLRKLQIGDEFSQLLKAVVDEKEKMKTKYNGLDRHILVKIAPDLQQDELEFMIDTIMKTDISGIIATNTTLSRDGLQHPNRHEVGGLSGGPLKNRSTEIIRSIYRLTDGKLPIIGTGGVFTSEDAYDKVKAGASLVEIYTALIYEGPGLIRKLNEGLFHLLHKDGYTHISQAIGIESGIHSNE